MIISKIMDSHQKDKPVPICRDGKYSPPPLDKPGQKINKILPSDVGDTPILYSPGVRFYITIPQIRTKDYFCFSNKNA